MTNLLATLIVTMATNWVTTSIETPVPPAPVNGITYAVYYPTIEHQLGTVSLDVVAVIEFRGEYIEAVLKSTVVKTLRRQVDACTGLVYKQEEQ